MRARDAEDLIAEFLTKGNHSSDADGEVSEAELLGLQRSKPIYARKIKEKEEIANRRRNFFYRRMLTGIAYPVSVLVRFFK